MAFANEWVDKVDDVDTQSAEDVNAIANEVIRIALNLATSRTNNPERYYNVGYINENFLSKENLIPFTPTQDYHPATKKFVLDMIEELGGGTGEGGSIIVDQAYDATSPNAQSGTAVAEAVGGKMDKLSNDIVGSVPVADGFGGLQITGLNERYIPMTATLDGTQDNIVFYSRTGYPLNDMTIPLGAYFAKAEQIGDIENALDDIIAIQNSLIGGVSE